MDEVYIAVLRTERKQMNPGEPRLEILAVSATRSTAVEAIITRWSQIRSGDSLGASHEDLVEMVTTLTKPQPWVLATYGDFHSFSLFTENVQS